MSTWKDFLTTLANGVYPQPEAFTEKDKLDFLIRTLGNPPANGNADSYYTVLSDMRQTLSDLYGTTFVNLPAINNNTANISNNTDFLFFVNRPFVAKGSSGPIAGGTRSANYIYANETFNKIHFTVTAVVGAANFVIEVSDDGTIFQTASFYKSNNTTKVNTIAAVVNDIYILDLPFQYWRISNTGGGVTSITVDCYGFK